MSPAPGFIRQAIAILLFGWVIGGAVGDTGDHAPLKVVAQDGFLFLLSNAVVVDRAAGLMWSARDNGQDISFAQAQAYLASFRLAGYNDWRFPTLQELETLLVKGARNGTPAGKGCSGAYDIHPFIALTCCCPWALQDRGRRPASFPFIPGMAGGTMWHHQSGQSGNRILPVRNLEEGWQLPLASP